ncbi:MAG: ArsA family ATPase [Actinomycetaceae bacterium]|nr:ArsA family ATPase [Actinomycetaceae bacterium]
MTVMRELALSTQVLFFSGKGGVGKTTLASATALAAAREGKRVLVVSTDPAHNLGHLWRRKVGQEPVQLWAGPSAPDNAAEGDGETTRGAGAGATRGHASHAGGRTSRGAGGGATRGHASRAGGRTSCETGGEVLGVELDADLLAARHLQAVSQTLRSFVSESMRSHLNDYLDLVRQSPGTHDSALAQTIAELCVNQRHSYDLVIFDTAPTGHTARLVQMPTMLSRYSQALMTRRKRANQFADIATALGQEERDRERDDRIIHILQGRQQLFADFHSLLVDPQKVAFVLVLTAERMPVLETIDFSTELRNSAVRVGAMVANRRTPTSDVALLQERRKREDEYVAYLKNQVGDIPLVEVPQLVGEPTGVEALAEVGQWL